MKCRSVLPDKNILIKGRMCDAEDDLECPYAYLYNDYIEYDADAPSVCIWMEQRLRVKR